VDLNMPTTVKTHNKAKENSDKRPQTQIKDTIHKKTPKANETDCPVVGK